MANNCKRWCGTTLVASIIVGLFLVLGVYLILRKINNSKCNGNNSDNSNSNSNSNSNKNKMSGGGGGVEEVDEAKMDKLVKSGKPTVAMVYADWCSHCQEMKPDFMAAAKEMGNKVNCVMMEGPKAQSFAKKHEIEAYPCMMKFKGGKMKEKVLGRRDKDAIKAFMMK